MTAATSESFCGKCGKPYSAGRKGTGIFCACALADARKRLAETRALPHMIRALPMDRRPLWRRALDARRGLAPELT